MPIWLFFRGPRGTNVELSKMDFAYLARPFVYVPAKVTIDLSTMDFTNRGQPFVSYAKG